MNTSVAPTGPSKDRLFTKAEPLAPPEMTFTVSARSKRRDMPVFAYLRKNYGNVPLREIDSLFGFVEQSTLYGGRHFTRRELSDSVVLPMPLNEDLEFLAQIKNKDKITLFAAA